MLLRFVLRMCICSAHSYDASSKCMPLCERDANATGLGRCQEHGTIIAFTFLNTFGCLADEVSKVESVATNMHLKWVGTLFYEVVYANFVVAFNRNEDTFYAFIFTSYCVPPFQNVSYVWTY